jgi:hypothetical protein
VAHDPRAPRLAAVATLVAGGLLVLSAGNLQLNLVGSPGISTEEILAVVGAAVAIVIANLANKQREVPQLGQSNLQSTIAYDQPATRTSPTGSGEVNPTTASVLASILGQETASDAGQVDSAISTLSSGSFGESVRATMQAVEAANQRNDNHREATPADEESGQTLQRVHVQPVPLPGRESQPTRDPSTVPGLEPDRVFVREGIASVPLPNVSEAQSVQPVEASLSTPEPANMGAGLPDLPDLADLLPEDNQSVISPLVQEISQEPTPTDIVLPDLDDLFIEQQESTLPPLSTLPDLPDLDDLF